MIHEFPAPAYDLAATLSCGQAFRWRLGGLGWEGVIGTHWVRLAPLPGSVRAETAVPVDDWRWLTEYLQLDLDLEAVLRTFPQDPPMEAAVKACRGLRLLRQPPWECLASFILSSTKQIVQIQQIISLLCARYGEPVESLGNHTLAFPTAARLAACSETELRACKMGFRAPYLLAAAQQVHEGRIDLAVLGQLPLEQARASLMQLPGVGRKIADCVLLFGYGFSTAFPIDVWILRALGQLYFPHRRVTPPRLRQFAATHFGLNAGYAQQYLFHFIRMRDGRATPHAGLLSAEP